MWVLSSQPNVFHTHEVKVESLITCLRAQSPYHLDQFFIGTLIRVLIYTSTIFIMNIFNYNMNCAMCTFRDITYTVVWDFES